MRRTTGALLLLLVLAPVAEAAPAPARCDITQLETLTPRPGTPPSRLTAGRPTAVVVDVVRGAGTAAEVPAQGIEVLIGLTGDGWGSYDSVVTGADGRVRVTLAVPRGVRGPAELDVEVVRVLTALPCLSIEEHGRVVRSWGRVG